MKKRLQSARISTFLQTTDASSNRLTGSHPFTGVSTGASLFHAPIRRAMKALARKGAPPAFGYEFAHLPSDGCLRSFVQSEAAFGILRTFGVL